MFIYVDDLEIEFHAGIAHAPTSKREVELFQKHREGDGIKLLPTKFLEAADRNGVDLITCKFEPENVLTVELGWGLEFKMDRLFMDKQTYYGIEKTSRGVFRVLKLDWRSGMYTTKYSTIRFGRCHI